MTTPNLNTRDEALNRLALRVIQRMLHAGANGSNDIRCVAINEYVHVLDLIFPEQNNLVELERKVRHLELTGICVRVNTLLAVDASSPDLFIVEQKESTNDQE